MVTGAVLQQNEVYFYGVHYPTKGPVTPRLISSFGSRIVIGDPSRSDQLVASEWIMSDWRGGMGVYIMDERTQPDRYWTATALGMFKKQLTLPFQTVNTGQGDAPGSPVVYAGLEFASNVYAAFDTLVQKYNNTTGVWATARALAHTPTDAIVYNNQIYFFASSEYDYSADGTTWTRVNQTGRYACIFDNKLVTIDNNGQVKWTIDGVNWNNNVQLPLPAGNYTSILTWWNQAGDPAIYVGTKRGMYIVDFWTQQVYPTILQFASSTWGGRALDWKDGYIYVSDGLPVHRFNGATVTPVGLDRDDGVPADMKGSIVGFARSPNWLVGILDASAVATASLVYPGDAFGEEVMPAAHGFSAILVWTGVGWHILYKSGSLATSSRAAWFSTAYSDLRLWFGADGVAKYIIMPEGVYNPLRDATAKYDSPGELITGWFDAGFTEATKIAISCKVGGWNLGSLGTNDPRIDVYYALEFSESWTFLGTIGTNAPASSLQFNGGAGIKFRRIRFRFMLYSSSAGTTAGLMFASLRFLKLPQPVWGWGFQVDCTQPYRGRSPLELSRSLEQAGKALGPDATDETLGEFTFRDGQDATQTHYVRVSGLAGRAWTGGEGTGIYDLTVVAP